MLAGSTLTSKLIASHAEDGLRNLIRPSFPRQEETWLQAP
jgi:hypothetical protein